MRLGLSDIRDWLKTIDALAVIDINNMAVREADKVLIKQLYKKDSIIADYFYVGKLDNKKDKSIGVYQLKSNSSPDIAIGGEDSTKTYSKPVSILIHWNKNARETEMEALDIFEKMSRVTNFKINGFKVNYIELLVHEPVDVGTDENNIYERVIEAIFYYQILEDKEV